MVGSERSFQSVCSSIIPVSVVKEKEEIHTRHTGRLHHSFL
jgi:hypothetical protein